MSRLIIHLLVCVLMICIASVSSVLEGGFWRCGEELYPLNWVCDGNEQCDDNSDEGEGCDLFPESGCPSNGAKEHFKCERTGECYPTNQGAERCETSNLPPDRDCQDVDEKKRWKCKDGRCIELRQVCDTLHHCTDGSDESSEPYDGCNRFPNIDNCSSWGGDNYIRCKAVNERLICTNMEYNMTDPESCWTCNINGERRCDDGLCINSTLFRNGVPDCLDGSDELQLDLHISFIITITVVIVITGILVSYACRALGKNNVSSCFHCNLCSSSRRTSVSRGNSNPGDQVDSPSDNSLNLIYPDNDIPRELINLLDDKVNNWEKKRRDSVVTRILNSQFSPTILKNEAILEAKRLYVLIHTDPVQYHHLYKYLANRCATVQELNKITCYLFSWEKEMHGMNKQEVIKCWRLHLGATRLTMQVINSVADEPSLASRCRTTFHPVREVFRRLRRNITQVRPREDSLPHKLVNLARTTIVPFVEASFFYFEQIKNIVFVHIFWTALLDLSRDQPMNHPFEFSLVLFMMLGISSTQLLFLLYSFYFAADIFEVGHKKECKKPKYWLLVCFKVLAVLISPFIPCYVLANHVYYNSKLSLTRRHLQTNNDSADEYPTDVVEGKEDLPKRLSRAEKLELYKNVCQLEIKSLLYRKLYSYFRVTSAILESTTVLVSLVLLVFVTGRSNRSINLIVGVENRLYSFLGVQAGSSGGLLTELNLMRDVVVNGSLLYSLGIVLSALVKYWYQAKNLAISVAGQVSLGLYLLCLLFNRLTTCVSLFATTQPLPHKGFDDGSHDPRITLKVAMFLFCLLLGLRLGLIIFYKSRFCWTWRKKYVTDTNRSVPDIVDQWVNVLVNTVVVIPSMVQTEPLAVLKNIQEKFNLSSEKQEEKRNSLRRKTSLLRVVSKVDDTGQQTEMVESVAGVVMPNMNFFTAPFIYDDLRAKIRCLWWENPTVKLEVTDVRKKIKEEKGFGLLLNTMKEEDVNRNIDITLKHLEYIGMVNSPVLNPAQTKREYFWLYMFVLLENLLALGIELGNGGVWTTEGHYYSWDIRLASFSLSLVFLSVYYNRYHLTSSLLDPLAPRCGGWLWNLPIFFCCKPETSLSAAPDEAVMERMIKKDTLDGVRTTRSIHTQTSFSPYSAFPPPSPRSPPPILPPREMNTIPPTRPPDLLPHSNHVHYLDMKSEEDNNPIAFSGISPTSKTETTL